MVLIIDICILQLHQYTFNAIICFIAVRVRIRKFKMLKRIIIYLLTYLLTGVFHSSTETV